MIQTPDHLAEYITTTLKTRGQCRIYQDSLDNCWYIAGQGCRQQQNQMILAFAQQHGWAVEIHTPGKYGIVADFTSSLRPAQADTASRDTESPGLPR
jgi:hypothetical protein